MLNRQSSINISIVLYKNKPNQVIDLIQDILSSKDIKLNHIYLIDHSPTNDLNQLSQIASQVIYYFNPSNLGYGAGHNLAIKHSINNLIDFHLVVNPDIRFNQQVLAELIQFMLNKPQVGLVMPKVYYPDGRLQALCKLLPTPWQIIARRCLSQQRLDQLNYQYTLQASAYNQIMQVPYLSGSFMLFRVVDLAIIGGFDERFFMYFEDTDISRRFYQQQKAWFYPHVSIIHEHNQQS
ncbi:MAG: hypothetical protein RLZZ293_544, partial [Pseudomonadota bacterium]